VDAVDFGNGADQRLAHAPGGADDDQSHASGWCDHALPPFESVFVGVASAETPEPFFSL
jgi:hypothetical protein